MMRIVAVRAVVAALVSVVLAGPLPARTMIYDILAKGSEWTLNVDGDIGTLKILGGRGSRTADGGWEMTMDVDWQGNAGTLMGWADGDNREQRVALEVTRSGGFGVVLSGYVARETDMFMAGSSRYAALPEDIEGAWYATQGAATATVAPTPLPKIPKHKVLVPKLSAPKLSAPRLTTPPAAPVAPVAPVPAKEIEASPPAAACRIRGRVTGEKKYVRRVAVYTSDFRQLLQEVDLSANGTYSFGLLPDGNYKVLPLAGGKFDVVSEPRQADFVCRGSQEHIANFRIAGISEG